MFNAGHQVTVASFHENFKLGDDSDVLRPSNTSESGSNLFTIEAIRLFSVWFAPT